jgi:L-rhamnose mutarotase
MNLSDNGREILGKLIDANYTLQTEQDEMESYEYTRLSNQVYNLRVQLIEEMGVDNYLEFMSQGQRMFS